MKESINFLDANPVTEYLKKVSFFIKKIIYNSFYQAEMCLGEEMHRANSYLHESSLKPLMERVSIYFL